MSKWLVAGASGMVGSAIVRIAKSQGVGEIFEVSRKVCDLQSFVSTSKLINDFKPDIVIDAAAHVGGIMANSIKPVDFLLNNLEIQNNLFRACHVGNVQKLVFLSSSCVYPKLAKQPIRENEILTGPLEETNSAYAIAKISGMRLIQAYRQQFGRSWISLMPTNIYGPNDNFSLTESHVFPALIRKFYEAKIMNTDSVTLWGSGKPRREFMHVDDLARAVTLLVDRYDDMEAINVGVGEDLTIKDLAEMVKSEVGYQGTILWDKTKPDGTQRKLLDITKLKNLGFEPQITLSLGLKQTYKWFTEQIESQNISLRV
jgi:GDP-L-fucose synthase